MILASKAGVMQFAEGQAVTDPGFTFRMAVGENVRGVEKFHVAQSANGAMTVCPNNAHPKALLMKSALGRDRRVSSLRTGFLRNPNVLVHKQTLRFADFDGETQ